MKQGLLAILAVGVLGLFCAWLVLSLEDRRSNEVLQAATPAGRDRDARVTGAPDRPVVGAQHAPRGAIVNDLSSTVDAPAMTGATVEPPPANGIEVLIRVRETKEPVPYAQVRHLEWSHLDPIETFAYQVGRQEEALERYGRLFEADAAGIVIVPRPREWALVSTTVGESYGRLDLDPEVSGRQLLELEPDEEIRVRVVDAQRAPVGDCPVALRALSGSSHEDLCVTRSGPDGSAVLKHARTLLRNHDGPEFAVALALLGREPVEKPVDPTNLPADLVELVLPPCGSVEIVLESSDGSPVEETMAAWIRQVRAPTEQRTRRFALPVSIQGGRALVSGIELGLDLRIQAWNLHYASTSKQFDGPSESGESVAVRVTVGAVAPIASGRALREDGVPLGEVFLDATLVHEGDQHSFGGSARVRTDSEGRFRVPVQASRARAATRTLLALSFEEHTFGFKLEGSAALSSVAAGSEIEVGDVYLTPPPLLASGRVVGPLGEGIRGALVTLEPVAENTQVRMRRRWSQQIAVTDTEGSFELRGKAEDSAFTIRAHHADYSAPEPLEIGRGSTHVLLTLQASGRIAGRFLLDPKVPVWGLELLAFDANGNTVEAEAETKTDGRFEIVGLSPGAYALAVRLYLEETELVRVEGLAVEPLKTTEDPALDPLDLQGRIRVFKFTVQDRDGRPVPWFQVQRTVPGQSTFGAADYGEGDEAYYLVTSQRTVDVRIAAEGYRTVELYGVSADQTVNLRQGIPIEVVFAENLRRFAEDQGVWIALQNSEDPHIEGPSATIQGEGRAQLFVGEPGLYEVALYVNLRSEGAWRLFVIGEDLDLVLEIADSDVVQTFQISVPEEALERTRREMSQ